MTRPHKRLKTRTELQNEKADVDAALILEIKREHEEVGQAAEAAGLFELGLTLPQMKEAMTEMVDVVSVGERCAFPAGKRVDTSYCDQTSSSGDCKT